MPKFDFGDVVFIVLLLLAFFAGGGESPPAVPAVKVTAVTYVYEKDENAVPSAVMAALDKLNRQGIVANPFEDDTKDGAGEVPDQYKAALAASKETKTPVLVVLAGDKVVRTVKAPTTAEQVLEAAK